jgi:2'-5' RNA ligase
MRLFACLKVPDGALPAIEEASKPLAGALGVRMLPPENWHITLKFIGEVGSAEQVGRIEEALSCVKFSPFEVLLAGAGAFPDVHRPRAIWIGGKSPGCVDLATKVAEALSFLGLPHERFAIHLTVARAPKTVADIEDFLAQNRERSVCSFVADRFQLMKSRLTPSGAFYEVIKEYHAQR